MHTFTVARHRVLPAQTANPCGFVSTSPEPNNNFRPATISAPGAHIPLEFTPEPPIKTQKRKKAEIDCPPMPLSPGHHTGAWYNLAAAFPGLVR